MEIPKDSIILAKTHPPMYLVHKYWARKPYNVVKSYIQKYSQPGDVILDPFCGSGVTVVESVLANRNAIGVDINPFSIFLSKVTITPVKIDLFKKYCTSIINQVRNSTNEFYGISCPYCNHSAIITQLIWRNLIENTQDSPNEQIEEIRIRCTHCRLKNHTINPLDFPDVYSKEAKRNYGIESEFENLVIKHQVSIPIISFTYANGTKFKQIRHHLIQNPNAEQIFSKRNLLVLGILYSSIKKIIPESRCDIELESIRNLLLATFTANIGQSSKMVWVIGNRKSAPRKKKEVGSWTHHFFWNPSEYFEINPWRSYKTRILKTIKGKQNFKDRYDGFSNFAINFNQLFEYFSCNRKSGAMHDESYFIL